MQTCGQSNRTAPATNCLVPVKTGTYATNKYDKHTAISVATFLLDFWSNGAGYIVSCTLNTY